MRLNSRKVTLCAFVATAIAVPLAVTIGTATAGVSAQADPTSGWTSVSWNSSSYGVENRTKAPLNQRFTTPSTGVGRVWINNALVKIRTYKKGGNQWYFKNGTYNNGLPSGGRTSVHFKNIKLWRDDR
jgi:hypothetical protein